MHVAIAKIKYKCCYGDKHTKLFNNSCGYSSDDVSLSYYKVNHSHEIMQSSRHTK